MVKDLRMYHFWIKYWYSSVRNDFEKVYFSQFSEPYVSLNYIFNSWNYPLSKRNEILSRAKKISGGNNETLYICEEPLVERLIDVRKEVSRIKYYWPWSIFSDEGKKDWKDRNTINKEYEYIATEKIIKLLEEWCAFLEMADKYVLVKKD